MKKALCVLLAFVMCFSITACKGESEIPADGAGCTPLMYKVSDTKGGVLYLLGSIHVGDRRTQSMADYVMDAYNQSSYLCVEADIVAYEEDIAAQMKDLQLMLCKNGKTIKDCLGNELYTKARRLLENEKLYSSVYDSYAPALWMSLVDEAVRARTSLDSKYGVDRFFINKASKDGKEIREVESVEFQTNLMLGISDEIYRLLIEDGVDSFAESVEALEAMYEIWAGGNEAEIEEMLRLDYTGLSEREEKLCREYNKIMLDDRNLGMADKAEEYLAGGGTGFYVVGEAHIVGEGALVQLLRERGYTVEKV